MLSPIGPPSRSSHPPVLIDYHLWKDGNRLDLAIGGIYEVRELSDRTLNAFSRWTDRNGTFWAHLLFNQRHQLLSLQIVTEGDVDLLIARGNQVWHDSDGTANHPVKLMQSSDIYRAEAKFDKLLDKIFVELKPVEQHVTDSVDQ